tara:strand:- start:327 stop:968 length:642 start_codon:yes stop_codon:yes gene_type:complete
MTERIKKLKSGETDHDYWAQQESARRDKRKANAKKRSCSYCVQERPWDEQDKAVGHNRRSCTLLKENKATAISENREWRQQFVSALKRDGLGPGALIKFEGRDQDDPTSWRHRPDRLYFVDQINWDECVYTQRESGHATERALRVRDMARFDRIVLLGLPTLKADDGETVLAKGGGDTFARPSRTIVSAAPCSFDVPAGFVDDLAPVTKMFAK